MSHIESTSDGYPVSGVLYPPVAMRQVFFGRRGPSTVAEQINEPVSYAMAEHGWAWLPLQYASKVPFSGPPFLHGGHSATTDIAVLQAFWSEPRVIAARRPFGTGLGFSPCPRPWSALDVDGSEALARVLERFPELLEWPLVVDTGRANTGRSFHLRMPPGAPDHLADGQLGEGTELKGGPGAYVRLAGCVHVATGQVSRWWDSWLGAPLSDPLPPTWDVPDCPPSLLREVSATAKKTKSTAAADRPRAGGPGPSRAGGARVAGAFTNPGWGGWGDRLQREIDVLSGMAEHDGRNRQAWRLACWLFGAMAADVITEDYAWELYLGACVVCKLTTGNEHLRPWRSARSFMSQTVGTEQQ